MKINKNALGYIFLFLAQATVALSIVIFKVLVADLPIVFILCVRFGLAGLFLFAVVLGSNREKLNQVRYMTRIDWFYVVAQSLCAGAFFNLLLILGLRYTEASLAGMIASTLPALVALFAVIFLKEKLTKFIVLCVACAVLGIMLINFHGFSSSNAHIIIGGLFVFMSLIPEATYYILCKLHQVRLPIVLVSAIINGINFFIFLLVLWLMHQPLLLAVSGGQWLLIAVSAMASALFYVFWSMGSQLIKGAGVVLSTAWMPVVTLVLATVWLGERTTWLQLAGMALVVVSIACGALKKPAVKNVSPAL